MHDVSLVQLAELIGDVDVERAGCQDEVLH